MAENPIDDDYRPLKTYFPDEKVSLVGEDISEEHNGWRMFFDGAKNLNEFGIKAVLISPTRKHYLETPNFELLRCVEAGEASRLVQEIYARSCGPHMNGFTLAKKILRSGYFWLTMETEYIRYVKKCHRCKTHIDMIRVPPNELHVTSSPWLFAVWAWMPLVQSSQHHLMDTDSFLLQLTTSLGGSYPPPTTVTKTVVDDFIKNNIICRFEIPESIVNDNRTNLNSDLMRSLCEKFKISDRNSTSYRLQMNGVLEATNNNVKRILRKVIDNHRYWHEKLLFALLVYRTTIRTSTRATPYFLVYGNEVVIPAEVEIPSLRIIPEAELSDAEWIQIQAENLTLIDGRRIHAMCNGQIYQNRMVRAFNKKVRLKHFSHGQLLKKIFLNQYEAKGKFSPNW
ncbi:uncharacterized protein LOC107025019 [Solanum pennellii]|uniref:Uncharacterized protein LOC107025019 n=1 Tax=Solanum pennellii TaxID=28526 RepID=A0ABM1H7A7_SOLPN|nr:uncharacterized protein LOC107025019 [Solanum pennellii]